MKVLETGGGLEGRGRRGTPSRPKGLDPARRPTGRILEDSQPPVAPRPPRRTVTETSDPAARDRIMADTLAYNEEDLDATWAVLEWLRRIAPPMGAA